MPEAEGVRVAVIGAGAVGARAVRQLASTPAVASIRVIDVDPRTADGVVSAIAEPDRVTAFPLEGPWAGGIDVGVLAGPAGTHVGPAERLLEAGAHVVSASDDVDDVHRLLGLDAEASVRERTVVVGAGFSPGLTDVLAAHAVSALDAVHEIHVAKVGTGGPACAREHHRTLAGEATDWRHGAWQRRRAGSGRELCWFPDPVGAQDCYRAAAPEVFLLVPAFPGVERVTARVGATRRDRLTARLPMLRPPHPEGAIGAVRVEVRGAQGRSRDVTILGAMDRPAVAAGAVAAVAAVWAAEGRLARSGAAGLAVLAEPVPFLAELSRRGIKAATFDGVTA